MLSDAVTVKLKNELLQDLFKNQKLFIEQGCEDNDSGSDSEPSVDNLSLDELNKLLPIKKNKKNIFKSKQDRQNMT